MMINKKEIAHFNAELDKFYKENARLMEWRSLPSPYYVLVSELMLQQTQVKRVMEKFPQFIQRFPTIESLASASLHEVLEQWIGLGYNRRAKFLKASAEYVIKECAGQFPSTTDDLIKLPGVGINTAGAILVYVFNQPQIFIETNIRTVFIHHFFNDKEKVSDADIKAILQQCIDTKNPRHWYWALMDYGTYLKKEFGNLSKKSNTYAKQSPFKGSFRQKRAHILREIVKRKVVSFDELCAITNYGNEIVQQIVNILINESFIACENNHYYPK